MVNVIDESKRFNANKLGCYLAFVAGAVNSGGFLAIGRYTSHMTGIVSELSDNIFLHNFAIIKIVLVSISCFMAGAVLSTILVNFGKSLKLKSKYAIVFMLEGLMILIFGLAAHLFSSHDNIFILMILTALMGLQNATMTKISYARIRTTHITGMITDISIEIGKFISRIIFPEKNHHRIIVNKQYLMIHVKMVSSFLFGGICGAYGFGSYGYSYVFALSMLLIVISLPSFIYEVKLRLRFIRRLKNLSKNL